jgi:gamma-glutamyltranspeptidase/glutathione hydrolase
MTLEHQLEFISHRSPVISTNGIVATSQPLAVAAGLQILVNGGNAADAAVAAAAALNVTEPTSTGIGGDCFAMYYDAGARKVTALNGSGRAPVGLTIERLESEGFRRELPPFHPYTITVPGACAGWFDLAERHGRLSMEDTLQPAIRLAEKGFPVAPITAYFWDRSAQRQLRDAPGGVELTIEGRAPRAGEIFRNLGLAHTFKRIAEFGKDEFYQGEIAQAIVNVVDGVGGCLSLEDLAEHRSTWEQPISTLYRDKRIWECPPNGQGLTALLALNILEGFEISSIQPLSTERLHLEIESLRLAFADTRWYVADPVYSPAPLDLLLSKAYAAERRKLIDRNRAVLDQQHGTPYTSSDTVYLSVVDAEGNACSFINSNYMGFGTGIVPAGWGFSLQNRGHNFSLDRAHPNALAPGKRPYHTIIPAMATCSVGNDVNDGHRSSSDDGELYASFGVMGGFMQPQGHLQVITALLDDGLDPQTALDRPRYCIKDSASGGEVALEEGISLRTVEQLAALGHPVDSDPRADGCAMSV